MLIAVSSVTSLHGKAFALNIVHDMKLVQTIKIDGELNRWKKEKQEIKPYMHKPNPEDEVASEDFHSSTTSMIRFTKEGQQILEISFKGGSKHDRKLHWRVVRYQFFLIITKC